MAKVYKVVRDPLQPVAATTDSCVIIDWKKINVFYVRQTHLKAFPVQLIQSVTQKELVIKPWLKTCLVLRSLVACQGK